MRACSNRMRGKDFKLGEGRFKLGCPHVAQQGCGCPLPGAFKARLNGAVSNLV